MNNPYPKMCGFEINGHDNPESMRSNGFFTIDPIYVNQHNPFNGHKFDSIELAASNMKAHFVKHAMKASDVTIQLIGEWKGWDQQDTSAFSFYDVEKDGISYPCVYVDFEKGIVAYYDVNNQEVMKFAIKASLVPLFES